MASPDLLYVLGRAVKRPYKTIDDFLLEPTIVEALKRLGVLPRLNLANAVGPNVAKGSDAIIISSINEESKKKEELTRLARTCAYMLPILKLRDIFDPVPGALGSVCGPTVLIVTSTEALALKLERDIQNIIHDNFCPPISAKYIGVFRKEIRRLPEILITDIRSLGKNMSNAKVGSLLFEKTVFLVFEGVELYDREQWETLSEACEVALTFQQGVEHLTPLQIIVTSGRWNDKLENYYLRMLNARKVATHVYFDTFLEVVRFAKMTLSAHYVQNDEERMTKLKELLRDQNHAHENLVVACQTLETAEKVKNVCLECDLSASVIIKQSGKSSGQGSSAESARKTIMIVTDDVLNEVQEPPFEGYTSLINFDNRIQQRHRFFYLYKSLPTQSTDSDGRIVLKRKNISVSFLMSGREPNFLGFYRFSKRLDYLDMPPELEATGKELHEKDIAKNPMCLSIELFGECKKMREEGACIYRHDFIEADVKTPAAAPVFGEIEVELLDCFSPSKYTALLCKHYCEKEGRTLLKSYAEECEERWKEMKEYYGTEGNRVCLTALEKGKLYAVRFDREDKYQRVKLLSRICNSSADDPDKIFIQNDVCVQCVDSGVKQTVRGIDLLILPLSFEKWKPLVVNIIIGDLRPPNGDSSYTPSQISGAKKVALAYKRVSCKVSLSIGDTVWVSSIVPMEKTQSLRFQLIESQLASSNSNHMKYLIESVRRLGRAYEGFEHLQETKQRKSCSGPEYQKSTDPFQWAYMEKSSDNNVLSEEVKVTYAYDPYLFFGILSKYEDLLESLETELDAWVNNWRSDDDRLEMRFYESLEPNSVVAVKDTSTDRWMRGLVLEKTKTDKTHFFDIFTVDFGETLSDIPEERVNPILQRHVNKLPFQVLAFSLNHVEPVDNTQSWDQSVKDAFIELMVPDGYSSYLNLAVVNVISEKVETISCRYYKAAAVLDQEEIGQTLVKMSLASPRKDLTTIVDALKLSEDQEKLKNETLAKLEGLDLSDDDGDDEDGDDELDIFEKFDVCVPEDSTEMKWSKETFGSMIESVKKSKMEKAGSALAKKDDKILWCEKRRPITYKPDGTEKDPAALEEEDEGKKLVDSVNNYLRHPIVLWRQTKSQIILNILLQDIKEFEIEIGKDGRHVLFRTTNPEGYGFYLCFFGKLKEECRTQITGQQMRIWFDKRMSTDELWCRLLAYKDQKYKWLKENPDFIDDNEEEDCNKFEYIRQGRPEKFEKDIDSDESENDDEDLILRAPAKYQKNECFFWRGRHE